MADIRHLHFSPSQRAPLLRSQVTPADAPQSLPVGKTHTRPGGSASGDSGEEDAGIFFIGTATTVLEWRGFRVLTDPNFLHAGDHVHLGPGVTAQRRTDPAVDLDQMPPMDCILLSHYHEDHFDRLVEDSLNRSFPIITTPHAKGCLTSSAKAEPFKAIYDLDFFQSLVLHQNGGPGEAGDQTGSSRHPAIKVTGMPGKHVPPGPLSVTNDILQAVPPTNGWLLELGWTTDPSSTGGGDAGQSPALQTGYRIYISGDTLFVDELKEIPKRLKDDRIDLMLVHLGGTTIPGPSLPLLMVTMDAKQGLQMVQLMDPDVTIPIHFDDYDVFMSPLDDFKKEVEQAGLQQRVVYLDRGEQYRFRVGGET
ncbi:Metallo-hydrolase/oxidoreductase [Pleurostoma richardsiae]|uniref:Metallo-hydrolase/oxidoreductase n=1 Tax=Pleurostoma richardsiae TaxID=41990 RepID=A0AA38RAN1_9PEZI|nr:Metallo-hydrolase/oxidoreductase [Pleurostoma richardsiae]